MRNLLSLRVRPGSYPHGCVSHARSRLPEALRDGKSFEVPLHKFIRTAIWSDFPFSMFKPSHLTGILVWCPTPGVYRVEVFTGLMVRWLVTTKKKCLLSFDPNKKLGLAGKIFAFAHDMWHSLGHYSVA